MTYVNNEMLYFSAMPLSKAKVCFKLFKNVLAPSLFNVEKLVKTCGQLYKRGNLHSFFHVFDDSFQRNVLV